MVPERVSPDSARRMALRAQGLLGRGGAPRTPQAVLQLVQAIQLDTISVVARSHELVCFARSGATGRAAVEAALWGRDAAGHPHSVEYWAHAACVLPVTSWPLLAFRRRRLRAKRRWNLDAPASVIDDVRRRLDDDGPLTATELVQRSAQAVAATAEALREAATWVGASGVALEVIDPPEAAGALLGALGD